MKYYNMINIKYKLIFTILFCLIMGKPLYSQPELNGIAFTGNMFDVDWEKVNYRLEHENLVYKTVGDLELKLDILALKGLKGVAPVVVYVHGGDWNKGNKTFIHRPLVEDVFQRIVNLGYRVVSIDYRLCRPQTPVPMAISDAKDAVRWVKKNGVEYGFDTDKIVFMGTSAGGHISMMAAYSSDDKYLGASELSSYSSDVDGLINCYGPVDVLRPFHYRSGITIQLGRWFFNKSLYQTFLKTSYDFSGLKYPEQKKELREFMEQHSVTSIVLPRYVPALSLHGKADFTVQPSNARVLHKYLDRYDIPNTMKLYKKVHHSFAKADAETMNEICNATQCFLNNITADDSK